MYSNDPVINNSNNNTVEPLSSGHLLNKGRTLFLGTDR